jgi:hypothetical protein
MFTRTDAENGAMYLLTDALFNEGIMRLEWWVKADCWYDKVDRARELGLTKGLSNNILIVYAYMNFIFFHAAALLEGRENGALKEDEMGLYFELSDLGRQIAEHVKEHRQGDWRCSP